jgi:hypothetical protein
VSVCAVRGPLVAELFTARNLRAIAPIGTSSTPRSIFLRSLTLLVS